MDEAQSSCPADPVESEGEGENVAQTHLVSTPTTLHETLGERKDGHWGGMTAAEAGQRSGERKRERRAAREREAQLAGLTLKGRLSVALSGLTQSDLDKIVKRHASLAAEGDTKSLHALARLIDATQGRGPAEDAPDPRGGAEKAVEDMTPAERQAAMAVLLRSVREQEEAAGIELDPRADEGDQEALF